MQERKNENTSVNVRVATTEDYITAGFSYACSSERLAFASVHVLVLVCMEKIEKIRTLLLDRAISHGLAA